MQKSFRDTGSSSTRQVIASLCSAKELLEGAQKLFLYQEADKESCQRISVALQAADKAIHKLSSPGRN